eukprot:TRINITY_DN768_c0_g1_i1.p1 TRINITY_DN768_c0_g1~~TRINITY_DN768_c0_g1_i1.p1  ORF type:complete len:517 (+),score=83.99 TRINITY_DN768_c0_g1_i1:1275-2825(+)
MAKETQPLLGQEPQQEDDSFIGKIKRTFRGQNAMLLFYLVGVVLIGTTNRVTFKIMQYSTINYGYFDSQFTTFVYLPINFAVIFFKINFTKTITPEMRRFPTYKFLVMGFLDSLQGLLIVVGGLYVPGIMQNLLLQGSVPVTMLFSIFLLRPRGCSHCRKVKSLLKSKNITFAEETTLPETCTATNCLCRVTVNGMEIDTNNMGDLLDSMKQLNRKVVLYTSAKSWETHVKSFYSLAQYVGAVIILSGLVVSVFPALKSGAGAFKYDLMFFTATIPTALSGVYKEIAFRDAEDMDVWYLNGWVALFQFLIGLTYAPLAAVMSGLPIRDIPSNLYQGLFCFLLGRNFVVDKCLTSFPCGDTTICCDSCNGVYPGVSDVSALWGMLMYMTANVAYNVFLVLVIKHGSAALMYVASTLVLPLGSICFTIPAFLGRNATKFNIYDGAGLVVVLVGLITYRFLGKKSAPATGVAILSNIGEPIFVEVGQDNPAFKPRTREQIRGNYYQRLGLDPARGVLNP